jgi:hypothetical protein
MSRAWSADDLERVFHKALSEGDARGVEAALTLMAPKDPRRAQRLYDNLSTALDLIRADRQREATNQEQP